MSARAPRKKKKRSAGQTRDEVFGKSYSPPGTEPGALPARADWESDWATGTPPVLTITDLDAGRVTVRDNAEVGHCRSSLVDPTITWVHVQGALEPEKLKILGEQFELHPLAMEDVLNTGQRPKSEVYGRELFVVMAVPRLSSAGVLEMNQVSLFLGTHYVVTFADGAVDPFEPVRARIRASGPRFQEKGVGYLFYALIDVIVDLGFPVLEKLGDEIFEIETVLDDAPDRAVLPRIHQLKRDLVLLRRFFWPQRELVSQLNRDDRGFFAPEVKVYLRDCYDHAMQMMDLVETYREMAGNLLELYLSSVSNRMNEAMRVLTVISTIFIPLSFLVGLYGMNFEWMPELKWKYGYPAVWIVIATVAITMLLVFRRKKWF